MGHWFYQRVCVQKMGHFLIRKKHCTPVSRSLLKLRLNLRNFEVIILVSNIICFESKTLLMYQNSTNWLGSDENLPMENLSDKILKILFICYVTRKLRVLRETGPIWVPSVFPNTSIC